MISLSHPLIPLKSCKISVAVIVCAIVTGLAGCAQQNTKPDSSSKSVQNSTVISHRLKSSELSYYQEAITALNKNDLDNAKTMLQKLSNSRPELSEISFNLALTYYKLNDLNGAESSLEQALEVNPDDPQILALKGAIETRKGHINQAENLYQKALTKNKNFANAHYNLALLYDNYYQDIQLAAGHYQRYLELTDYKDRKTLVWLEEINSTLKLKTQLVQENPREPLAQLENSNR